MVSLIPQSDDPTYQAERGKIAWDTVLCHRRRNGSGQGCVRDALILCSRGDTILLLSQRAIYLKVEAFLKAGGLYGKAFSIENLINTAQSFGHPVIAEPFFYTGGQLRGVLIDAREESGVISLFYPVANNYLSLLCVGHELGHLLLGHRLHRTVRAAIQAHSRYNPDEWEAEQFAVSLTTHWLMWSDRKDSELTTVDRFLKTL